MKRDTLCFVQRCVPENGSVAGVVSSAIPAERCVNVPRERMVPAGETDVPFPLVSVVMPVFNTKPEYLREAVSSVLGQTLKKFELLVVDDCSEPYIGEIIRGYGDERIRYFRLEENSGAAVARNYALDRARGEMIAFLDSDDISRPERLEKQYGFLQQHPEIGLVGTSYCEIGQGHRSRMETRFTDSQIKEFLLFDGCLFRQSSVMLRKALLDDHNIRYKKECTPAEDYALWLDIMEYAQFAMMPEVLTLYRIHPASVSKTQSNAQLVETVRAQVRAIEKYCKVDLQHRELWEKFYAVHPFSGEELAAFSKCLTSVLDKLVEKGYSRENLVELFRERFKKHFYKVRSLKGQWTLLHSELADCFGLSWSWRLFCLVTRGIL